MLTEASFTKKVEGLADDIRAFIIERGDKLLKSGAVSLDDYEENSYLLPKLFICAIGDELKNQYWPHHDLESSKRHYSFIKNISRVI